MVSIFDGENPSGKPKLRAASVAVGGAASAGLEGIEHPGTAASWSP